MEENRQGKKAVAIKYEPSKDQAPRVVAKGQNLMASKIIEQARKHHVHVEKNRELAEELYKININQEIPEELYEAVAKILVYIYNNL